jgi:hypothetical protein
LASIATDDLEPPALLCGFGGESETVHFVDHNIPAKTYDEFN